MIRFYFQGEGGEEGGEEGPESEDGPDVSDSSPETTDNGDSSNDNSTDNSGLTTDTGLDSGSVEVADNNTESGTEGLDSESIGIVEWGGELSGNGPAQVVDSGNDAINLDSSVSGNDNIGAASTPTNDPIEGDYEENSDPGNINGNPDDASGSTGASENGSYRESADSVSYGAVVTIDPAEGSFTVPLSKPEMEFIGPDLSITLYTGERAPSLSIGLGVGIPFTVGFKFGVRLGHVNGVYGGVNALGFNQESFIDYGDFSQFLVNYSSAGGPFGPNSYSNK
jgi:hypothetical protein